MDFQLTLECCQDLLDRQPYGHAAMDLLYMEVLQSSMLTSKERKSLLSALGDAKHAGSKVFGALAWSIADALASHPEFATLKADLVLHALTSS